MLNKARRRSHAWDWQGWRRPGSRCWGTVRPDGSPRISPVEPYLEGGQLLIGAMAWLVRAAGLHREPRYVLHSVVTGPTPAKMNSSCTDPRELRTTATRAWWSRHPEQAAAFLLGIATALFIEWDLEHGVMTTRHWSPAKRLATTAPAATRDRHPPPPPMWLGHVPARHARTALSDALCRSQARARCPAECVAGSGIRLPCAGRRPQLWRGGSGPGPAWPAAGREPGPSAL